MVSTHNDRIHTDIICAIIRACKVTRYLEIGVDTGVNLKAASKACLRNAGGIIENTAIVGVDTKSCEKIDGAAIFQMTSDQFFQVAQYPEFDMVFIDGDHSPGQVMKDLLNSLGWVKDQGLVLMHDTYPGDEMDTDPALCDRAFEVADSISRSGDREIEVVTLPYSPGLTIIRKRKTHLPWLSR